MIFIYSLFSILLSGMIILFSFTGSGLWCVEFMNELFIMTKMNNFNNYVGFDKFLLVLGIALFLIFGIIVLLVRKNRLHFIYSSFIASGISIFILNVFLRSFNIVKSFYFASNEFSELVKSALFKFFATNIIIGSIVLIFGIFGNLNLFFLGGKRMKKSSKVFGLAVAGFFAVSCLANPANAIADGAMMDVFSDVSEGKWYFDTIQSAFRNGLISGYEDGTIRPGNFITRAEVAAVISKAFAATKSADLKSFEDVNSGAWYYDSLAKAVNMGVFSGDDNGLLNPSSFITREEVATVISKALCLSASNENVLASFDDANSVSKWAVPYVSALVENNIMAGDNNNRLKPTANITRAEFAQVMINVADEYVSKAGTVTSDFDSSVIVRVPNVVLKNNTIDGDVIVADGVGTGDFTLDNVKVTGNVIVRGGGVNSVKLLNGSSVKGKILINNRNGKTRIYSADIKDAEVVVNTPAILDCDCDKVIVNEDVKLEIKGNIANLEANASVEIAGSGKVTNVVVNADDANITGTAKVQNVAVKADDVTVTVSGAKVTADSDVTGTKAGEKSVEAGKSETVGTSSNSGSNGGGGSSSSSATSLVYTITDKGTRYEISGPKDIEFANGDKYYVTAKLGDTTLVDRVTVRYASDAVTQAKVVFDGLDFGKIINTVKYEAEQKGSISNDKCNEYISLCNAAIVLSDGSLRDDLTLIRDAINSVYVAKVGSTVKLIDVCNSVDTALFNKYGSIDNVKNRVSALFVAAGNDTLYSKVALRLLNDTIIRSVID